MGIGTLVRKIKNLFHLLESIAACVYFGFPGRKLTVIGVSGTDGKTTTVNLIHHILTVAGFKTAIWSTLSSAHTTTPSGWKLQKFLSQSVKNGCTHVALEISSHAIDQNRIWGIPFMVGVLTNIADNEHLDYHGSFEKYYNTKLRWLNSCEEKVNLTDSSSLSNLKKFKFESKLLGDFNKLNCLAAIGAAKELGIGDDTIRIAVASFSPPLGRLEVVIKKPFIVIVDFAHTPQAFEKVLPVAVGMKRLAVNKLIHVFGCTGDRDKSKRPVMGEIAGRFDDVIILTHEDTYTENPEKIIAEIEVGINKTSFRHSGEAGHDRADSRIDSGPFDTAQGKPGPSTMSSGPNGQNDKKFYFKISDRRMAIQKALEIARAGDVVIITGMGHQKSMNIGGKDIPWSDQETVLELMHDNKK